MPNFDIAPTPAPSAIGPYRIVREIGRGGMGFVYEAVHEQLQRRVAIKLLRWDLAAEPDQVARFVREGRAACNIRHPHVIEVYEFGQHQGAPYLVMDLVDGETLGESLRRTGPLPLPELLAIMLPTLSAVAAAHESGVVHRDLKPGNIMLSIDRSGHSVPKVLDFGTSKLFGDKAELALTQSAAVIGTPYYMSPEQARASRHVDERCDQYSLGVIMYECATGVRPFEGESIYDLMHAIMTAEVRPPSQIASGLPRAFDRIIKRAMSREPDERYQSVAAFGTALLELAGASTRRLWADEFKRDSERRGTVSQTLADVDPRKLTPRSSSRSSYAVPPGHVLDDSADLAQRARTRWIWTGLLLVLALGCLLAWRLGPGSTSSTLAPLPHAARPADPQPSAAPADALPRDRPPLSPLAQPSPAEVIQPPDAVTSQPGEPPAGSSSRGAGKSMKPERRARGKHGKPSSSPVGWGDNGAPIIE